MEEIMSEILRSTMNDGDATPVTVEIDPLMQMDAVLFFCQGEAVRWGVNHMDDNSPIYSAFQIERSTARLWGVGLPYLMREQQGIMNDAWRGMMDNAAFAAFPQIEINTNVVQRADGSPPLITPFGAWERTSDAGGDPGMIFYDIPIHQEQYSSLIEMAMRFIDTETNISVLASGEQGTSTTQTAGGIGLPHERRQRGVPKGDPELRRRDHHDGDRPGVPLPHAIFPEGRDQGRLHRARTGILGPPGAGNPGPEPALAGIPDDRAPGIGPALQDAGIAEAPASSPCTSRPTAC